MTHRQLETKPYDRILLEDPVLLPVRRVEVDRLLVRNLVTECPTAKEIFLPRRSPERQKASALPERLEITRLLYVTETDFALLSMIIIMVLAPLSTFNVVWR